MTPHYRAGALRSFVADLRKHTLRHDGTLDPVRYHRWRTARANAARAGLP